MDGIVISYRRDDSAGYAGRLYDRLAAHFGADQVFMDVEGIEPGLDFVDAIEEAVSSCRVLIAVIGDEWTSSADAAGRRRLDDPNDFIHLETGAALKRGIRVVPVLLGGAVMPLAAELPEELKALTRRQAIEINHKQWEASTGELIRTLESILKTPPVATAASNQPSADPNAAKVIAVSGSMAGNAAATHGNSRRWALSAAAAMALVAAGLWMILGDRNAGADAEKQPVDKAVEAPAVALAPGPKDVGPAVAQPAASVAPAKPAEPEKVEPVPVAKPLATPVPAPVPSPVIREFKADVNASRTRLYCRVSNADSLTLSPRPGELKNAASDCIEVKVDTATTFTLTARNGSATTRKTLSVVPGRAEAPPTRATAPAAAPGPAAVPAVVASSRLPAKGER